MFSDLLQYLWCGRRVQCQRYSGSVKIPINYLAVSESSRQKQEWVNQQKKLHAEHYSFFSASHHYVHI